MIKFMFVARRAAGTTRKGALGHLRDIHAKMVVCPPPDAGPMPFDYVQNHVVDGAYPGAGDHGIERDLVTELWFDSVDHLRASTATPYYLENLRPDEPRFVDDATVARMMVHPRVLLDGEGGCFKAFIFICRGEQATWDRERHALTADFLASPGLVAAIENEVLPPPTGGPRFVDIVLEGWFPAIGPAAAALGRAIARLARPEADGVAADRSFAVVAEQYDTARLRTLHGFAAS